MVMAPTTRPASKHLVCPRGQHGAEQDRASYNKIKDEGGALIEALKMNKSLKELELSIAEIS